MLFTIKDIEFFSKYLDTENSEKMTCKLKVKADLIPKKDREKLIVYDDSFYSLKGYHMIANYEELL